MSVIHFTSQLLMGSPPHCTCHLNPQLPMGGRALHIACHFNFQLLMGRGSSTLHISFRLSSANLRWFPPHFTSSDSHIILGWDGILYISQPDKVTSLGVGDWETPLFTSSQSHSVGLISSTFHIQSHIIWGWGYPLHLTNQVECASAVKPS